MKQPTDYQVELDRIETHIAELEGNAFKLPIQSDQATKYVYRIYQRAALTGNLVELRFIETQIDRAIQEIGPAEDLCLLKANLDFKLHRLAETRRDLEMSPRLLTRPQGKVLLADLAFQEGRYEEARTGYEELIEQERTWDNLSRLAFYKEKMGEVDTADQLYLEAEDELTAKEMRSFAWIQLQRGLLNLRRGRFAAAGEHYRRAAQAYSGYWMVEEQIAELLATQGKYDEAVALYEKVLAEVPKPELQQTLGELYVFMGQPEKADPWYDRALAAYLESAERGEIHYYHHLTDFYADVRENSAEAVKWARKDIVLRNNYATQSALAFALYRDGQLSEAVEYIEKALASGVKDAGLYGYAASIYSARANEINPNYQNFHVHRS